MAIDTPARIAIIGGGPLGIEAALYGRYLGYDVAVYEQQERFTALRQWKDFPLDATFEQLSSPLGRAAIATQWPDHQFPDLQQELTASQWLESYLLPLSQVDLISDSLHEHARVQQVGRESWQKQDLPGTDELADELFLLSLLNQPSGVESWHLSDVVLNASGALPCAHVGPGGLIPLGWRRLEASAVRHELISAQHWTEQVGPARRVMVIGQSRAHQLQLAELLNLVSAGLLEPLIWVSRLDRHLLMAHCPTRLRTLLESAIESGQIELRCRQQVSLIEPHANGIHVKLIELEAPETDGDDTDDEGEESSSGQSEGSIVYPELESRESSLGVDLIWCRVETGQEQEPCSALAIDRDSRVEAARALMPWLSDFATDGSSAAGMRSLQTLEVETTEPNYYELGARSFGRWSDRFSFAAGLEQIRTIYALLFDRQSLDLYRNAPKPSR